MTVFSKHRRLANSRRDLPQPDQNYCHAIRGVLLTSLIVLAALCLFSQSASAQLPQARLNTVFPTGGQRGTSVELTLAGGTDLDEASQLYFSHAGITAVQKTQMVDGKPQPVAGQFVVTIAADVPVGMYDVRARSIYGLSNPRAFTVGDRKEVVEVEPDNTPDKPMAIELSSVVNGRSDGGADIDWYKLAAKAGQRVIVELRAKQIDSRMEAAVDLFAVTPTGAGRRLLHRRTLGRQEPLLDFTIPADGEYLLKVHDFLYNGSAEYFYRLAVHVGPHIDFVLPASGLPNTTAEYTLYGRNLPGGQPSAMKSADGRVLDQLKVQIALPADATLLDAGKQVQPDEAGVDGIMWSLASPAGASNPVTIYFASAPPALEVEPNDTADKAHKLTAPVEVTGQFQARGDVDLYQIEAKANDVYWVEVFGQRSSSPADPVLIIDQVKKNDKGEETLTRVTALDDNAVNIGATLFNTTTDDPVFRLAVPADGTYRIALRDRAFESHGDPSLVYRLSIRKETPDFRLVAIPSFPTADPNLMASVWDIGLRKGDNAQMTVMAFRRDGFNDVIDINVEGLPAGVTCPGASIGPGQVSAMLVFSANEQAPEWHGAIRILGKGRLEDAGLIKAVTDQETARRGVTAQLSALDKAVVTAAEVLKAATDKAAAAKTALDGDANNEGLKKAKADADAVVVKATDDAKKAGEAKAAGDKKMTDLTAALAAAQAARDQAAHDVVRVARGGTIVWGGNPAAQQASHSRVSRTVTLAVLKEVAPYQVAVDAARFSVNQGSQILVPFKLLKRAGFDNNVNITFLTPPQNLQVENKPINKGTAEQVYRLYVQNNVAPGTYTLFVQSQAPITYIRNPEAAAEAAKAKEVADKLAVDMAALSKAVADAKVVADKTAVDTAAAAKVAADAKVVADKKAVDTAAATKVAADAKVVADKLGVDTAALAKLAADAKVVADKLGVDTAALAKAAVDAKVLTDKAAVDAEAAAKAAVDAAAKAKEALDKDVNNETLKKAKTDADALVVKTADDAKKVVEAKAVADKKVVDTAADAKKAADAKVLTDKAAVDTAAAAKTAADAKIVSDKAAVDTAAASKAAADAKVISDKAAVDTDALAKKAVEEKTAADKLAAETDLKSKAAVAAKAISDKKATDTANVAKPQNLNAVFPAAAITVTVKTAPGTLALAAPNNGVIKRGANIEVKATIARTNGFAGPVTLSLPLPPGVAGLAAAPVTIPADKNEETFVIVAAGDATLGQLANMVVRASMEFNGAAAIDQPIALNVTQ